MTAESHALTLALGQLLPGVALPAAVAGINITGLALDSRKVAAGDIFMALPGERVNGNTFIAAAISGGASAILVEADTDWQGTQWLGTVPVIALTQLAQQVSEIAARFYHDPSAQMRVTGVTGTNGKTTCSLLLGQIFAHVLGRAGVIGTLGSGLLNSTATAPLAQQIDAFQLTGLTTPDPIAVQHLLAQLREQKASAIAMEVSSHSLVQARVAAVSFSCAIFTNLTQDHLDYHGDLMSYGKAKQILLSAPGLRHVIVNADDAWAKNLLTQMPESVQAFSYSTQDTTADVYAQQIELTAGGICADIVTPWGEGKLRSSLLGEFNLSNLLAVMAAACAQDLKLADVLAVIPHVLPAPGRMQPVVLEHSEQDIGVIVDYAHTPDALENTIEALLAHKTGRLWTVFGCGGDRDRTKRPLMGRIAERLSDYVIVTNDNPRNEEPAIIAADILRGMHNPRSCLVIADRAQAIDLAVQQAKPGDLILVAGKGHEDYQIFAAQTLPFSDVKHVRLSLQRRLAKRDAQLPEAKA